METSSIQYLVPIVISIVRYFIIAGLAFVLFHKLFPKRFIKNKIQVRIAKKKDFFREILHSMQTTLILAGVGLLFLNTPLKGYTKVYDSIADYPLWWIPVSVVIASIIHDSYFYWMHRIIHHPKLYKYIHAVHHKSINPSPWASYSFNFIEGVLESLIAPILFLLMPIHPIAIVLFVLIGFTINVYGHLGYEIAPRWFRHSFLFEIMNTSTHHNIHHSKFTGNFGLYYRFWDRIMGTEHPDYVKKYDEIQKRRFGNYTPNRLPWKGSLTLFFIIVLAFVLMSAKSSRGVKGNWKDPITGVVIQIYEDDGFYFWRLIEANSQEESRRIQENEKIILMKNFKKKSETEYCVGTVFQPKMNRTISATLVLKDENTLGINGEYGIISGTRIWKRY